MKLFPLILLMAIATCFVIDLVEAVPEMTCKQFVSSLTKKQLGGISACSKKMKFKNPKEKAAKMNCILKCVLIKEKLLDANGQFVGAEKFEEFIEAYVPVNLMDKAAPKFRHCRETAGVNLGNSNDKFCKSYDPLIKCMLDTIGKLCK